MISTTKETEKETLSDDELFEIHLKWKEDLQKLSNEELLKVQENFIKFQEHVKSSLEEIMIEWDRRLNNFQK
tara:strand:- start:503 stop:718 length:216 start_codon:yes stop_codon:yes gene_type:complete